LSDRELAAFRGMYPGPYRTAQSYCDYFGPLREVVCRMTGETVIHVKDDGFRGQARLVIRHIAAALNLLPTSIRT
jgi:hypothetical protein